MQGFKVDKVYLDYSGSMRQSFQVGTRGRVVVFGNNSAEEGVKSSGLERKYRKNIFGLSNDELEEAENGMVQGINEILAG
jgi:hypothetical protein